MEQARPGIATRDGMPVLNFFVLVYRSGGYWYARSVYTGDVAESSTVDGAIRNLVHSIDFAISIAEREEFTAEEWHAAQIARTPEKNYVDMFLDLVAQQDLDRNQREAPSGHYIRNLAVAQNLGSRGPVDGKGAEVSTGNSGSRVARQWMCVEDQPSQPNDARLDANGHHG